MSTAPAPEAETRYGLAWAIKRTFVSYVGATPDGRIWLGPGVRLNHDGEFLFPLDERTPGPGDTVSFRGEVGFTAHGGFLNVLIADPWFDADGTLSVRTSPETGPGRRPRVPLCELRPDSAATRDYDLLRCRLTEQGAALFGGPYARGSELDPAAVHLPAATTTLLERLIGQRHL
jgi:hypothetical protein